MQFLTLVSEFRKVRKVEPQEKEKTKNCPKTTKKMVNTTGQFEECLVYLYDNGCPGDEYTYENVNRCRFQLSLRRKAKRNT
jgi:hypothetical protein